MITKTNGSNTGLITLGNKAESEITAVHTKNEPIKINIDFHNFGRLLLSAPGRSY